MNKNNMNNTNASVSASKRNRHEDAVKVISLLTVLKKTIETASHFEEYKNDFESFRSAAVQALMTASDIPDNEIVLNGYKYPMNANGIESMLVHMDKLDHRYQKADAANDELPHASAEYLSFLSQVFDTAFVISENHTDTVFADSEINNHTLLMKNPQNNENAGTPCCHCSDNGDKEICQSCVDAPQEVANNKWKRVGISSLLAEIQALSDRLYNFENNAGKLAFSTARDALALDVVKLYERIQIIEGRVSELEDIGERVPDIDEEIGDIYRRINTLEEKAKPPINIPAEACDPNKLMKLFGIHQDCTDTTAANAEDGCKIPAEMESIDIPEILDVDAQTGDIMALDTNDITAVHTGDIKVGRIGHNINIKIGGDVVINGDDDIK